MVEFRTIPDFPDYEVSESGTIRRIGGGVIKSRPNRTGYIYVGLRKEKKQRMLLAHRAVATAWISPSPFEKACVAHLDGDRTNNQASNLSWVTHSENERQKVAHGTSNTGERNPASRLTEALVTAMRERRTQGISYPKLGREFGVSTSIAHYACTGKNWRHVPVPARKP